MRRLSFHVHPFESENVRLKVAGHVKEVFWSSSKSSGGVIRKVDKDHFFDVRTGEVKEFNHIENRSQDLSNVAKSLSQGRDILNTNILDVSHCRWVTLTYAENMTDSKRLYYDFMNFNKRLRKSIGHYEYITAAEPQGRGAWHLHVVMIFDREAPYLSPALVSDCWKRGFIKARKLDNVDNVGAYLTAYLGDMELTEAKREHVPFSPDKVQEKTLENEAGQKVKKKFVKGGRLFMYPSGMHIFRWSKGIKKPTVEVMTAGRAEKKVSGATLTFEKTVALSDNESGYEATFNYRYYHNSSSQKSK